MGTSHATPPAPTTPPAAPSALLNTTAHSNTASGYQALYANTLGPSNTASGFGALSSNTTGNENVAMGYLALISNILGNYNTGVGTYALANCHGYGNTALGQNAGYNGNLSENFTGSSNIYIGQDVRPVSLTESNTIRIGGSLHTKTFIAGIATTNILGNAVMVNGQGQLGVPTSSRRYKEDIRDMGEASRGLMQLRPVTFHYKPEYHRRPPHPAVRPHRRRGGRGLSRSRLYDPQTGRPQTVASTWSTPCS